MRSIRALGAAKHQCTSLAAAPDSLPRHPFVGDKWVGAPVRRCRSTHPPLPPRAVQTSRTRKGSGAATEFRSAPAQLTRIRQYARPARHSPSVTDPPTSPPTHRRPGGDQATRARARARRVVHPSTRHSLPSAVGAVVDSGGCCRREGTRGQGLPLHAAATARGATYRSRVSPVHTPHQPTSSPPMLAVDQRPSVQSSVSPKAKSNNNHFFFNTQPSRWAIFSASPSRSSRTSCVSPAPRSRARALDHSTSPSGTRVLRRHPSRHAGRLT